MRWDKNIYNYSIKSDTIIQTEEEIITPKIISKSLYYKNGRLSYLHIPKYQQIFTYKYDSHNNLIKQVELGVSENVQKITTYTYDNQNKLLEECVKNSITGDEYKTSYKYDSNGNVVEKNSSDKDFQAQTTYEYKDFDEHGNWLISIENSNTGSIKKTRKICYWGDSFDKQWLVGVWPIYRFTGSSETYMKVVDDNQAIYLDFGSTGRLVFYKICSYQIENNNISFTDDKGDIKFEFQLSAEDETLLRGKNEVIHKIINKKFEKDINDFCHRIGFKFDNTTTTSSQSIKERLITNQEKVKKLVQELETLQNKTRLSQNDIVRVTFCKQSIMRCMDEGADIAKKMNDTKLYNEYLQRKKTFHQSFEKMRY